MAGTYKLSVEPLSLPFTEQKVELREVEEPAQDPMTNERKPSSRASVAAVCCICGIIWPVTVTWWLLLKARCTSSRSSLWGQGVSGDGWSEMLISAETPALASHTAP